MVETSCLNINYDAEQEKNHIEKNYQAVIKILENLENLKPKLKGKFYGYDHVDFSDNDEISEWAYPEIGFKIHIPLNPAHPNFPELVKKVSQICDEKNSLTKNPTTFKVGKPSFIYRGRLPLDFSKSIVLYPNKTKYDSEIGEESNLQETLRLDKILGPIVKKLVPDYDSRRIPYQDIRFPYGLWVRFGGVKGKSRLALYDGTPETASEDFWIRFVRVGQNPLFLIKLTNQLHDKGMIMPKNERLFLIDRYLSEKKYWGKKDPNKSFTWTDLRDTCFSTMGSR